KPIRGDSGHALLSDAAARAVNHFLALPLAAGGECLGAVVVYSETRFVSEDTGEFSARDRLFLELCAGMLAERLDSLYKAEKLRRSERMLEEVQSHLVRERAGARIGTRAHERHDALVEGLRELREAVGGRQPFEKRVARAREVLGALENETALFLDEVAAMKSSLQLVDLFALVHEVTEEWAPAVRASGVELTVRIPARGPVLLMDRGSIALALRNILGVLAPNVGKGDRVLIECSATEGRAVILVADTAGKLDGTLLSRLFMPFASSAMTEDPQSALSAAGDILQRHAGEITVKSSPSWKTILALSFPVAANTDRRHERDDRRRRRSERRRVG
ncbi:MAG TPA: hypothetical protein VFT13_13575, partial [Candidatus Krumholzibacteria bacterium]|nr:hypothetical protein [Candidatus Krumholzibacteria bacterium]